MARPLGLRHGEQIYFPVIEQDDGQMCALCCVFIDPRSIHNSRRIGAAAGRSSIAEAKLP